LGFLKASKPSLNDLEFNPSKRIPFAEQEGWYIAEYNRKQGVGICHLYVVYALNPPGYITVKGIAIPDLGKKLLLK